MPQRSLVPAVQKIAAAEALRHEPRQVAAVIEVRVRQDDGVDVLRGDRQVLPVALAQLLQPLEQPGVDEHLRVAGVEQVLRAGDRLRRAEKRDRCHRMESNLSGEEADLAACVPEEHRLVVAKLAGANAGISPAIALAV